jgi:hypothetical protein
MADDDPPPLPTLEELGRLPEADLISLGNRYFKLSEKATDAAFFPLRAQIFMQELARRTQDRQTTSIIAMTKSIKNMTAIVTIMTAVIMMATMASIWPDYLRPAAQWLWLRAWQVIGRCG